MQVNSIQFYFQTLTLVSITDLLLQVLDLNVPVTKKQCMQSHESFTLYHLILSFQKCQLGKSEVKKTGRWNILVNDKK